MKFKRLTFLLLAAPLALLAACGNPTVTLSFSPNWYENPVNYNISDTYEFLEYAVTFEKPASEGDLRAEDDEGTYTAELSSASVSQDGKSRIGYRYTTRVHATGRYSLGGRSKEFEESIVSEVWFLGPSDALRPVRSVKTVDAFAPYPSATRVEDAATHYNYTFSVEYNEALTRAQVSYDDLLHDENDDTATVKIGGSATYLDNEEMIFALRGAELVSGLTFRKLYPVKQGSWKKATVALQSAPADMVYRDSFAIGGTEEARSVEATTVILGYSGGNTGGTQSFTYAKRIADGVNTYRNVLLSMRAPLLYGLGYLNYKLKSAQFTK